MIEHGRGMSVEIVLMVLTVAGLIVTELIGWLARRWGFITISEAARKNPRLKYAVSAAFIVALLWWQFHA